MAKLLHHNNLMTPNQSQPRKPSKSSIPALGHTQITLVRASIMVKPGSGIASKILRAAHIVRFGKMHAEENTQIKKFDAAIEEIREEAEANDDLLLLLKRWRGSKDPILGHPSAAWKRAHPQMYYHLQSVIQRPRLENPATQPRASELLAEAKTAFLDAGGDVEETRWWPADLQEEFLFSLAWQWKCDIGAVGVRPLRPNSCFDIHRQWMERRESLGC